MKTLYFMIGTPGVGKTTFLKNASQEIFGDDRLMHSVVGPDNLRLMVECPSAKVDGTMGISQNNEKYVWNIINQILDKKTNRGELIIVDATHSRNKAISVYKKYSDMGYRVVALDFSKYADIETTLERNRARDEYKFVPEEAIRTIQARIDVLDIPTWVEVLEPKEFVNHFTDIKYNFDQFDSLTFIGDIHGCRDELQRMLDACAIDTQQKNTNDAIVFVGDYFDRGYDVVGTFKLLQKLQRDHWVMFLRGNHEEPLEHYKEFLQLITTYLQKWIVEHVIPACAHKEQLLDESKILNNLNQTLNHPVSFLGKLGKGFSDFRGGTTDRIRLDVRLAVNNTALEFVVNYEEEAVLMLEKFVGGSYKQLDQLVLDLEKYPKVHEAFKEQVRLYKMPTSLIRDPELGFHKLKRTSLSTVKKFLMSDIKYTEITAFTKGLAQMFWAEYHKSNILATHGGLADIPTRLTPTADMIRGVGGYSDTEECDQAFLNRTTKNDFSIHGHRNMANLPVATTDRTFNINGDVDLGLRAVTFHKDKCVEITEIGSSPSTLEFFRKAQLHKAKKFNAKKLSVQEEGQGLMRLFQDHAHVDVKKLPNNIAAINFTRKAFEKGIWDNITIKARGLFAGYADDAGNGPNEINIMARGYEKFFNLGERHGFDLRDIRNLAFPIVVNEKANGYLGLLAVDNRDPENPDWFISSKTTTTGDFAMNFRGLIEPELTPHLMQLLAKDKVTLVFEVIDPVFDPHIEEYKHAELVLLDAIKNDLNFETTGPDQAEKYMEAFSWKQEKATLRQKKIVCTLENFNEFYKFVEETNSKNLLDKKGMEGFVFEDSSPSKNMFKLKTDWYSFWKYMRSLKERISSTIQKNTKNGKESVLDKAQLINLKKKLHREEDIVVFNWMQYLAEKDPQAFKKMSIIDIRNSLPEKHKVDKDV